MFEKREKINRTRNIIQRSKYTARHFFIYLEAERSRQTRELILSKTSVLTGRDRDGAAAVNDADESQQLGAYGQPTAAAAAGRSATATATTATAATGRWRHSGEGLCRDRSRKCVGKRDAWVSTSTGPTEFTQL